MRHERFVFVLLIPYFVHHAISVAVEPCACVNSTLRQESLPVGASEDYGHKCRVHDRFGCYANYGPNSLKSLWDVSGNNDWCCQKWCYVSAECSSAEPSTLDAAWHYSYEVCGDADEVVVDDTCVKMTGMSAEPSAEGKTAYTADVPSAVVGAGFSLLSDSSLAAATSEKQSGEPRRLSAPPRRGKGGGGGTVGGSSRSMSVGRTGMYMGAGAFAGLILLRGGSRRRYGSYDNEPGSGCAMKSSAVVEALCNSTIATNASDFGQTYTSSPWGLDPTNVESCQATVACCYSCLACTTEACMKSIAGCEDFYAGSFSTCEWEEHEGGISTEAFVALIATPLVLCCCCFVCYASKKKPRNQQEGGYEDDDYAMPQRFSQNSQQGAAPYQMQNYGDGRRKSEPTWPAATGDSSFPPASKGLTNYATPNRRTSAPPVFQGSEPQSVVLGTPVVGGRS